ncbi:porin [Acinetobacter sp. NCu2D-2]|uniref:porin n=1 Tax=Acinetobacter sp. NCu2D-2 TaxID=1608473 RepID=UPI0007CDF1A2|nr:porin [Acinetobacter sp. NCu2D-2]ANF81863.1 porin [Acinetobacter sp. NCu2D-2]
MKKTFIAFTLGATVFTPILASAADVKIYGRAHVSLDYLDDGQEYRDVNLSSNSSRIGFKAEHQLENDMTVFGQIEQEINFASASKDSKGVDFATRDTFVGLKGNFGQVKVGRFDSPFKVARNPVNYFGDMVGDVRNVTRVGNQKFDERNENTIEYKSPNFAGGFNVAAAVSMHSATGIAKDADGSDQDDNKAYDLALTYKNGPSDIAVAYEKYEENSIEAKARHAIRVAGAYDISEQFKLGALYQHSKVNNEDQNASIYGVAGEYKLAPKTTLRGEYFYRDVDIDDANSSLIAIGVEHRLDKDVRLYANLATMLNDDNANLTPWKEGRSAQISGATGENATALSLGFRYDF